MQWKVNVGVRLRVSVSVRLWLCGWSFLSARMPAHITLLPVICTTSLVCAGQRRHICMHGIIHISLSSAHDIIVLPQLLFCRSRWHPPVTLISPRYRTSVQLVSPWHRLLKLMQQSSAPIICLGALQRKKFKKIRDYYGSGWVGPGLTRSFFVWKIVRNGPKPVLIFWCSIPCVFCTLLKVVGYYDLSVLSMSVIGFQNKTLDGGWVGGVISIQVFF